MVSKREHRSKSTESSNNGSNGQREKFVPNTKIPRDDVNVMRTIEFFEKCLADVFESRRDFYLTSIASKLMALKGKVEVKDSKESGNLEWIEIESLSRLRAIVGGRFQNIKNRWIEAGLPLREHRGDRKEEFQVNHTGWIALSSWVSSQGYETRLTHDKTNCLFEIRLIDSSKTKG